MKERQNREHMALQICCRPQISVEQTFGQASMNRISEERHRWEDAARSKTVNSNCVCPLLSSFSIHESNFAASCCIFWLYLIIQDTEDVYDCWRVQRCTLIVRCIALYRTVPAVRLKRNGSPCKSSNICWLC